MCQIHFAYLILHLPIPDLILKLYTFNILLFELFPLQRTKVSISCNIQPKLHIFFLILCIEFKCCNNLWIFHLLYSKVLKFYKVQLSINFKKIILKFLILSVALALNGNQSVLCKGNNSNNKILKCIILESSRELTNGILVNAIFLN